MTQNRRSRSRTRSSASGPRTTTRTPPRSNGHLVRTGEAFPIMGSVSRAVVFKDGDHVATAKEFVRFLVAEGWLAHYLDFSGERMLPPMPKLLEQPFWLDPSDPHRMAAVMQVSSRPTGIRLRAGLGQLAARPGLAGVHLGEGDPSRRRRRHQPRAGGRRGDRPHQADPERIAGHGLRAPSPDSAVKRRAGSVIESSARAKRPLVTHAYIGHRHRCMTYSGQ